MNMKKLKRNMWWLGKYHNVHNGLWLSMLFAIVATITLGLNYNRAFDNPSQLFYIFGCLGIAGCICGIAIVINTLLLKTPLPNPASIERVKSNSRHNLRKICIFPAVAVFMGVMLVVSSQGQFEYLTATIPYLKPLIYSFIIITAFFLFIAVNIIINNLLIKSIYQYENYKELTQSLFDESYAAIQQKNAKYDEARTQKRTAAGKLPKTPREYEKERAAINYLKIGICVILCALLFVTIVFIRPNAISLDNIEKISVGDNMGYIERMLGEPYDKSDIEDETGKVIAGTWKWSSNPKAKLLGVKNRQMERLMKQLETADIDDTDLLEKMAKLAEEIFNLEAELEETVSDRIFISHENNVATVINFEKDYVGNKTAQKSLSHITYALSQRDRYYVYGEKITGKSENEGATSCNVNIRMYFADGSMSNFVKIFSADMSAVGERLLNWSDEYGEHTVTLILT